MASEQTKIQAGVSAKDYSQLVQKLYKDCPAAAQAKISEFGRTFDPANPFFKFGKAENFCTFEDGAITGHITAVADNRAGKIGAIGFFECEQKQEVAGELFATATEFLKKNNKTLCQGPVNMTVWQNFRLSYPEGNPPFYLEPFTREYYRDLFIQNGFTVAHKNLTTVELIEKSQIKNYAKDYASSLNNGYKYNLLDISNAKKSIADIYTLTSRIFAGSFSFYDISLEEFSYFAKTYLNLPAPHYIFILETSEQKPVGFFLAVPDLFNPKEKKIVLKTMGILPEYRGQGLGKAMFYFIYDKAKKDGYKKLVFSTMEVENEIIHSITAKTLTPYRQYEVYEKQL